MSCTCNHTHHDDSDAHHCCEHDHDEHHHGCDCGCEGHEHHGTELSRMEHDFLVTLAQLSFIPLARFLLSSTKSNHLEAVALAPVYIMDGTESVAEVRERGAALSGLEAKGLVTLDYDQPLENFDYEVYHHCAAYHELEELVREGKQRDDFLFDTAGLETGSIALTEKGQLAVAQQKKG